MNNNNKISTYIINKKIQNIVNTVNIGINTFNSTKIVINANTKVLLIGQQFINFNN